MFLRFSWQDLFLDRLHYTDKCQAGRVLSTMTRPIPVGGIQLEGVDGRCDTIQTQVGVDLRDEGQERQVVLYLSGEVERDLRLIMTWHSLHMFGETA